MFNSHYEFDIQQISAGCFSGDTFIVFLDDIHIGDRHNTQTVLEQGQFPETAFLFSVIKKGEFCSSGIEAKKSDLVSLSGASNYKNITTKNSYRHSLSILDSCNRKYLSYEDVEFSQQLKSGGATLYITEPESFAKFEKCLASSIEFCRHHEPSYFNSLITSDITESIIFSWLHCIMQAKCSKSRLNTRMRYVTKAIDFLSNADLKYTSLKDLIQTLHISHRVLEYAFKDCLGMSPKQYLTRLRLNAIRKELILVDPFIHSITDIVKDYGVVNTGRFAKDYFIMFGEKPKETLNGTRS